MGRGREPWEQSEAGGVNDHEWRLHHSPVSSLTEELWKDKRRSDDSEDERGPGLDLHLCFVCGSRPWGAAAFLLCSFIFIIKIFKCSPSSRIYELSYSNLLLWRISWKFSFAISITWYFRNQSSMLFRMLEEQNVEFEIFGNIINVFTVTYDQFNVSFRKKKYSFLELFYSARCIRLIKSNSKRHLY